MRPVWIRRGAKSLSALIAHNVTRPAAKFNNVKKISHLTLTALCIASCAKVPVTGRSQLNILDDKTVTNYANEGYMQFMSEAYRNGSVVSQADNGELTAYVNKVGLSVLKASGLASKQNWEIVIIRSNVANAFVLPNGKIVVNTGLLPVAKNEAGLAAIIGHEIAHVSSKHTAERLSQTMLSQAGLNVANNYLDKNKSKYNQQIAMALGLGVKYGLILPYSREHESEADLIGQIYMAKAGYDPKEAVAVWERMQNASKDQPPEFSSTHPSHDTRIKNLKGSLALANMYYVDQEKPLPRSIDHLKQEYRQSLERSSVTVNVTDKIGLRAGYWYSFRKSGIDAPITVRYESSNDCEGKPSCLVATYSSGEKRYLTDDYGVFKVETANGAWTKFSPSLSTVRYPLAVNKTWTDRLTKITSTGESKTFMSNSKVVDYAEVEAGSEMVWAYRVIKTSNGQKYFDGWWAPSLCSFVSTIQYVDGKAFDSVLLDYKGRGKDSSKSDTCS